MCKGIWEGGVKPGPSLNTVMCLFRRSLRILWKSERERRAKVFGRTQVPPLMSKRTGKTARRWYFAISRSAPSTGSNGVSFSTSVSCCDASTRTLSPCTLSCVHIVARHLPRYHDREMVSRRPRSLATGWSSVRPARTRYYVAEGGYYNILLCARTAIIATYV